MSQQIQNKLPIRYLSELDLEDYGCPDIVSTLECINEIYDLDYLTEADFNGAIEHLKLEILDVDRFIKVNDCQEVTNPVFYSRNNIPTDDGLMSNKIFGITRDDRAGIFAYIDLGGWFIDPSCYKAWIRIDPKVKDVVHGMDTYSINDKGEIVEDPNGKNGVQFLKDNISKIKFRSTESIKRDIKVQYLEKNRNLMFLNKYIVIPPFYRDTNTGKNSVGVGGVNVLYRNLLLASIGLKSTQDYGFDQSVTLSARIQETLLNIYDWFAGNSSLSADVDEGTGIAGKKGVLRRANMSKTTNYSSRMVIASPELKAESVDDMMVDMDHTALPLAACLANYRPFMIYQVKTFFENEFIGNGLYPMEDDTGNVTYVTPVDPLITFSDEAIKREMDRFIEGYNNRFVPVMFNIEEQKDPISMRFKCRFEENSKDNPEPIYRRRLTWCDVFYQAACEVTRDKAVLITRYPMDSYFNQIATQIVVASTNETEPLYINDTYYPYYPKIREEDIGSNTGNEFIDTLKMSNLYLDSMGGDYDGDMVTAKSPYTIESNEEIIEFTKSKANFINLGGKNSRIVEKDVVQTLYSLTKTLNNGKQLTDPEF